MSNKKYRTEYERLMAEHPWLMRWENFKMSVTEFFWRFHPRRNRWCDKCGDFIGNSKREVKAHVCKKKD